MATWGLEKVDYLQLWKVAAMMKGLEIPAGVGAAQGVEAVAEAEAAGAEVGAGAGEGAGAGAWVLLAALALDAAEAQFRKTVQDTFLAALLDHCLVLVHRRSTEVIAKRWI